MIEDLSQSFGSGADAVDALGPITLDIAPGEFITIVGPSGCGKTTLIRAVAGFLSPTAGTIRVGDRPVTDPGPDRGMVFQHPRLFPWLDVAGNVELGLRFRGVQRSERKRIVDDHLRLVGLDGFGHRRPYELSGGMQQRCQIARVLAGAPSIMLMDEPFGALDALTRERLQNELLALWRQTRPTVVFITHSVDEAVFLGSRVLVMSPRPGRIVLDEPAVFEGDDGSAVPVEDLRSWPDFVALRERVRAAIQSG